MSEAKIVERILRDVPAAQAVYLYGSTARGEEWPASDIDIAVLLPHLEARERGSLAFSDTRFALEEITGGSVDLVNLRRAPIVLQKEVLAGGRRLFTAERYTADEYEMYVLSLYGKLNEERAEILEAFAWSKRAYPV